MEKRLDPQQADEVVREAVRLQQEYENQIPQTVLEQSAQEMGIDPAVLREALQRVEQERERRAQRQRTALIALFALLGVLIVSLIYSHSALNRAWNEVESRARQLQNVEERQESLLPRLEALMREVDSQQRAKLQTLVSALKNDPASASALLTTLQNDPSLRNDWLVVRLMDEIAGSENRIAVERRRYNEAVTRYEQVARQFPVNLLRP
ncbi:MAG: LemA family protein, partial [Fimbriimonadales bacterium]